MEPRGYSYQGPDRHARQTSPDRYLYNHQRYYAPGQRQSDYYGGRDSFVGQCEPNYGQSFSRQGRPTADLLRHSDQYDHPATYVETTRGIAGPRLDQYGPAHFHDSFDRLPARHGDDASRLEAHQRPSQHETRQRPSQHDETRQRPSRERPVYTHHAAHHHRDISPSRLSAASTNTARLRKKPAI